MTEHELTGASAERLKRSTIVLPHEAEALMRHEGDTAVTDLFNVLGEVDVTNTRLYKQLVEWHTRFPSKPTLEETELFWKDLKRLRQAKLEMEHALERIRAREKQLNSLSNQLENGQKQICDVERYFDSYLDRIHERGF
jgi:DNA repair exonuclease SbcCD ATPase subunit